MKPKKIVNSLLEPDKNCLWFYNGVLKHWGSNGWKELIDTNNTSSSSSGLSIPQFVTDVSKSGALELNINSAELAIKVMNEVNPQEEEIKTTFVLLDGEAALFYYIQGFVEFGMYGYIVVSTASLGESGGMYWILTDGELMDNDEVGSDFYISPSPIYPMQILITDFNPKSGDTVDLTTALKSMINRVAEIIVLDNNQRLYTFKRVFVGLAGNFFWDDYDDPQIFRAESDTANNGVYLVWVKNENKLYYHGYEDSPNA